MSLTTRPTPSGLPSQPRSATVEDDDEETTKNTVRNHAPYDPFFAPDPSAVPQVSKDFAVRYPQPQRSGYQSGHPSAFGGWGPGSYLYRYPAGSLNAGGAAYGIQPRSSGWAGSPYAYNYQSQPVQGPAGQHDDHIPAEIIPIDRDPERLIPYADLWRTEKLEGELSTWLQPRSCLTKDTQCELLTIRMLEHGPDETGHVGTTLICENGPPRWNTDVEPQIRWLHAQRTALSFACLERLVSMCPFVRFDLMKVTLRLLKYLSENVSSVQEDSLRLEPGTALCYVGQYTEPVDAAESQRTDPVMFLACPSLDIAMMEGVRSCSENTTDVGPQSLLNTLYGYDVGIEREKRQIVRKMAADDFDKSSLQVRQTWILRIGNNVLITMSNQKQEDMLGKSLRVGNGKSKVEGKISVRLQSQNGHRYNITFDRGCRFADFHKKAVSAVMGSSEQLEKFGVLDPEGQVINETSWPQFVSSSRANAPTLNLVLRDTDECYSSNPLALPAAEIPDPPSPLVGEALTIQHNDHFNPADDVKSPANSELSYTTTDISRTSPEHHIEAPYIDNAKINNARAFIQRRFPPLEDDMPQRISAVEYSASRAPSSGDSGSAGRASLVCHRSNETTSMTVSQQDQFILSSAEISVWLNNVEQNPPTYMAGSWQDPGSDFEGEPSLLRKSKDYNWGLNFFWPPSPSEDDYQLSTTSSDALSDQWPYPHTATESGGRSQINPFALNARTHDFRQSATALSTSESDPIVVNAYPAHVKFSEPNGKVSTTHETTKETVAEPPKSTWKASLPFFQWRPHNQVQWATVDDRDQSMSNLFAQVQMGLLRELKGNLYDRAFQCSRKDLIVRSKFQLQQLPPNLRDTAPAARTDAHTQQAVSTQATNSQSLGLLRRHNTRPHRKRAREDMEGNDHNSGLGASQYGEPAGPVTSSYDAYIMREIVQISTKIFSAFIPNSNTSGAHEICNLYWGAVDCIFRQIQWHRAFYVQSEIEARFATHIAGRGHTATVGSVRVVSSKACKECQLDTPYASDQRAIEHLHVAHGSCGAKAERPHDDPCFAWLHQVTIGGEETASSDVTNKAMDMIEDFHGYLSQLSESISELRTLATRAGKKLPSGQGSSQILLPPSLTRAFQHILEMYILRSHALSLRNKTIAHSKPKGSLSKGGSDARRISELLRWEKMAFDNTKEHINTARQKIFLADDPSNNMAVLGIEQVGIEFLMCALIGNIQSQSPAVPLPSQTQHTHGSCLELYQAYVAKLRFQCYQRPQRKVFLEIYSFEEELMALKGLLKAQRKLLESFNHLMSFAIPDAYIYYHSTRYAIESEQWRRQLEHVDRQESELQMLQDKCSGLKEQVKQAIEVIEENHGKAIRVFTIVTLFFLPLSFVSTFLGMNTTDVDGLRWDQSIFWATSLPLTAVVLTLAILYGYKGDEISDWFRSKNSGDHWWPSEQRGAYERERKAKPTQPRRISGILRRPTTDSLGIDT